MIWESIALLPLCSHASKIDTYGMCAYLYTHWLVFVCGSKSWAWFQGTQNEHLQAFRSKFCFGKWVWFCWNLIYVSVNFRKKYFILNDFSFEQLMSEKKGNFWRELWTRLLFQKVVSWKLNHKSRLCNSLALKIALASDFRFEVKSKDTGTCI